MEKVESMNAPQAIGPYSQAVKANDLVFCSGQIPLTVDGILVDGGIDEQVTKVMQNLLEVLIAAGASFGDVVKTTIFLANMDDFAVVNEIYSSYFTSEVKPARATVEVSRLPKDVLVEIDCIAVLK
jgi:2-iminobutanoate/2-iminopropanoate deaminase